MTKGSSLSPINNDKPIDRIAICKKDLKPFASGFGAATDIGMGSDCYLYIISYL